MILNLVKCDEQNSHLPINLPCLNTVDRLTYTKQKLTRSNQ